MTGSWPDVDATALELQPADRPDVHTSGDDRSHETIVVEPASVVEPPPGKDGSESDGRDGGGRWLPLRDALREVGSLERLYGLAEEGLLRSREDESGQVEVWIADSECYVEPAASSEAGSAEVESAEAVSAEVESAEPASAEADAAVEAMAAREPSTTDMDPAVAAVLVRLVEAHGREVRLARENGALGERVAVFERELIAMRARDDGEHAPVVEATDWRLELARENGALTERLAALEREREDARTRTNGSGPAPETAEARTPQLVQEHEDLAKRIAVLVAASDQAHGATRTSHVAMVLQILLLLLIVAVALAVGVGVGWLIAQSL